MTLTLSVASKYTHAHAPMNPDFLFVIDPRPSFFINQRWLVFDPVCWSNLCSEQQIFHDLVLSELAGSRVFFSQCGSSRLRKDLFDVAHFPAGRSLAQGLTGCYNVLGWGDRNAWRTPTSIQSSWSPLQLVCIHFQRAELSIIGASRIQNHPSPKDTWSIQRIFMLNPGSQNGRHKNQTSCKIWMQNSGYQECRSWPIKNECSSQGWSTYVIVQHRHKRFCHLCVL